MTQSGDRFYFVKVIQICGQQAILDIDDFIPPGR
jgi:hypothetical protein